MTKIQIAIQAAIDALGGEPRKSWIEREGITRDQAIANMAAMRSLISTFRDEMTDEAGAEYRLTHLVEDNALKLLVAEAIASKALIASGVWRGY